MFALVRTATEGRKQDGISFLLIDMKTPGLTVRPITGLDGEHDLNEVFFDDVIVPIANRVGAENSGWEVAKRSEEHTSELQSLMRISYAVFCLKKKKIDSTTSKQLQHKQNQPKTHLQLTQNV